MTKDTHFKNRNLDDHINEQFVTNDGKTPWTGQELEVKSDPLVDLNPSGETAVIRVFDFAANPETLKQERPTKQQLFSSHAKQIETMLWADGLQPIPEVNPIIQVSKKKEKYRIYVTCKAKKGVLFSYTDTPRSLQDIINPHATRSSN